MIGQLHYAITRTDTEQPRFWRSRGNGHRPGGWVSDMSQCRMYRRPGDALSAARQIDVEPGITLEVVEVESVAARVCYRITTMNLLSVDESGLGGGV